MPDKKLTDSEIVKGFKLLVKFKSYEFKFLTDPFDEFKSFKLADVLDLIYRLQKKNKDLQERNVILKGLVDTQKAEIEKLQNFKAYFDFYYGCDIENIRH
ncbi:MAG: hypothetical protein IJD45_01125 [Clostridia bacterium]|nr:hypothetical protein [Clostridia bacterium]